MANSSGRIGTQRPAESFEKARFAHAGGGEYQVARSDGGYSMTFTQPPGVEGTRLLSWFVGSGRVGRSYLFSTDSFLFQAPVSYYSTGARWSVSPGFQRLRPVDLSRGVEPSCLRCHASGIRAIAGTQNQYEETPFTEAGVSCERCHGPGDTHIERMTARNPRAAQSPGIVQPAMLDPQRRDSVCAQCHLTGGARVARLNAKPYQAGQVLWDSVAVYVWSNAEAGAVAVTSHVERMEHSRCGKASGGKLWCASCHDPHGDPEAEKRPAHFRGRCQACHAAASCTETAAARAAASDDCTVCHMPKQPVFDSEHAVYTDHSIPRRPRNGSGERGTLLPFRGLEFAQRDRALALSTIAMTEPSARREAFELLRAAEAGNPADAAIAGQLAQFYDRLNAPAQALPLYERVVKMDPANTAAAVNLGTILIGKGDAERAMSLWRAALDRNPGLVSARMNLAVALLKTGDWENAKSQLDKVLIYDPGNATARELLAQANR